MCPERWQTSPKESLWLLIQTHVTWDVQVGIWDVLGATPELVESVSHPPHQQHFISIHFWEWVVFKIYGTRNKTIIAWCKRHVETHQSQQSSRGLRHRRLSCEGDVRPSCHTMNKTEWCSDMTSIWTSSTKIQWRRNTSWIERSRASAMKCPY